MVKRKQRPRPAADVQPGRRRCLVVVEPYMRSIEWRRAAWHYKRNHRTCERCGGESLHVIGQGDAMEALCEPCRLAGTHAQEPLLIALTESANCDIV